MFKVQPSQIKTNVVNISNLYTKINEFAVQKRAIPFKFTEFSEENIKKALTDKSHKDVEVIGDIL